jgi:hypothetical protein
MVKELRISKRLRIALVATVLIWAGVWIARIVPDFLPIEIHSSCEFGPGIGFTNVFVERHPWSINVVRLDRAQAGLEVHSVHATDRALGMANLTAIVSNSARLGLPLAGVNGDFYQRERAYAGDPRGLQIVQGEVISAPVRSNVGGAAFWIDAAGHPHTGYVRSEFAVRWPDGRSLPLWLNEERLDERAVLYTPALGNSTHTKSNGLELVLEPAAGGAFGPLRLGETFAARVRTVRTNDNTRLTNGLYVLSLGKALAASLPAVRRGDLIELSTATTPELKDARTALGGGPVLLLNGARDDWDARNAGVISSTNYSIRSMAEEHPRTALGWNESHFFLVQVDGRQSKLSIGMTLRELARVFKRLGCTEAMNLDGGGSATIWCNGKIVNSPADKKERAIANALVIVRRPAGNTASK